MIPFPTTPAQAATIDTFTAAMTSAGVCPTVIREAAALARTDQGVFDLLQLWYDEPDPHDRELTLATLRQCLQDYGCRLP